MIALEYAAISQLLRMVHKIGVNATQLESCKPDRGQLASPSGCQLLNHVVLDAVAILTVQHSVFFIKLF